MTRSAPCLRFLVIVIVSLGMLAGCSGGASEETMTVIGGSELKDLEPLLPEIERQTGVKLALDYVGTLEGAEQIMSGSDMHDLAWFSHSKYLELLQQDRGEHRVKASERIMLSPVVLGVKQSVAKRLGWAAEKPVTWRDIAQASVTGRLRFAMTNPASSNSGFTALVGVASAFAGSADALNGGEIDKQAMKDFFKGQKLTAGSSGFLADAFVGSQDSLDGLINYESVLLSLNEEEKLREKLVLIYPSEGIITADYPLLLLDETKRESYDKLVEFLQSPEFQAKLTKATLRRPATAGVAPDARLPEALLVELPFPSTAKTIDAILLSYLNEARPPAHATFVIDTSGSMADDDKIGDLREALGNLAGLDSSLTGRFSHFHDRERITFIQFSSEIAPARDFTITDSAANGESFRNIRAYVDNLRTDGGTAIFKALIAGYRNAAAQQADDPSRYHSIVLMTDGLNNAEQPPVSAFLDFYARLPAQARKIRTFAIVFGDASPEELQTVADATGGRVFDARDSTLASIFKDIRGYQ